ncbi:MAG TPA: ABC transporter permease [Candidatus Nanoarchaeia archaeon]|nr:ABC transporter permease [Candidatus Nanoarchaeia archaeon]
MIEDYARFAVSNLLHRKLRSLLTVLGIIIGVAAIIALISVSQGLKSSIEEQFATFGADRLLISAKGFQGPGTSANGLTEKDVDTLERIADFKYVIPSIYSTSEVEFSNKIKFTYIVGVPSKEFEGMFADVGTELAEGRYVREGEKKVAVIGARVADELFDKKVRLRSKIMVNGEDFTVIGILKEIGSQQDDNQINIPLEAYREVFDEPDKVDVIIAQAKEGSNIELLKDRSERALKKARDDENYQVMTAAQIAEQINNVLGVIQIVLIGIAAISLVVGGIGIMNSMYTSVLERTKEIGVMKSIGAHKNDILMIFLLESGLLGLVGGLIGVGIGVGLGEIVEIAAAQAGYGILKIPVKLWIILFGLGFAFLVGIASGTLPAMRAAKLSPVSALHYE